MVGVMHFYSLVLDTLFSKCFFDNFQFQYIYGQKALKSYPLKHLTFGPFFSSQPFFKPQMLSNTDNLHLLHMILQNFRFHYNNSNEIAQT